MTERTEEYKGDGYVHCLITVIILEDLHLY